MTLATAHLDQGKSVAGRRVAIPVGPRGRFKPPRNLGHHRSVRQWWMGVGSDYLTGASMASIFRSSQKSMNSPRSVAIAISDGTPTVICKENMGVPVWGAR